MTDYYRRLLKITSPKISLQQVSYNDRWSEWFAMETDRLKSNSNRFHFIDAQAIGSAAIPGMSAKNIIDIAGTIDKQPTDRDVVIEMELLGYQFFGNSPISPDCHWFWKIEKPVSFVVHLVQKGSLSFDIAYLFRDYLREHPEECAKYIALKNSLANRCDDLFSYSVEKTSILCRIFSQAEQWRHETSLLKKNQQN